MGTPESLSPGDHVTLDSGGEYIISGVVERYCDDLDGYIYLTDDYDSQVLRINGWLFSLIEHNGMEF